MSFMTELILRYFFFTASVFGVGVVMGYFFDGEEQEEFL